MRQRERERERSDASTAHRPATAAAAAAAASAPRENSADPEFAPQLPRTPRKCRCAGFAYAIGLAVALGTVCLYLIFILLVRVDVANQPWTRSDGRHGDSLPQTEERTIHNKNHRRTQFLEAQARRHEQAAAAAADDALLAEDVGTNDVQAKARDAEFEAVWSRARPIQQLARCSPDNAGSSSSSPLSSSSSVDSIRFEARQDLGLPPFMSFRMLKTESSESCCSICAALPQCKALMYTATGPMFQNSNCFLFKTENLSIYGLPQNRRSLQHQVGVLAGASVALRGEL